MDAKKIKETRVLMSAERDSLLKSIGRSRLAAEEIRHQNTEDEGDLATMSHDRELLYKLHESDHTRLKFIETAIKAMDRGQYGECANCEEEISDKRLAAVPWATMCIRCQDQADMERLDSPMVLAGREAGEEL